MPKLKDHLTHLTHLLFGHYPRFIYRKLPAIPPNAIPIFLDHHVEPHIFERKCRYLAENGYKTYTADQVLDLLISGQISDGKSVLLTFDDGLKSLWSTAFPILQKYGLKATAFIVPGMVPDDHDLSPQLKPDGYPSQAYESIRRNIAHQPLCNWREISTMQESGTIDFQSHSMYHHTVFTSHKKMRFIKPSEQLAFIQSNISPKLPHAIAHNGFPDYSGLPIYPSIAQFQAQVQFVPDEALISELAAYIRSKGGKEFFRTDYWESDLKALYQKHMPEKQPPGRYLDFSERKEECLEDMKKSKFITEQKLGKEVLHFCYPWHRGSEWAVELTREAGYKTNFWGVIDNGFLAKSGSTDPFFIPRMSSDFIQLLPGKNRVPYWKKIANKFNNKYGLDEPSEGRQN